MKNRTISALAAALLLAASVVLPGCSRQASGDAEKKTDAPEAAVIKIGVFEPLTGANSIGGNEELEGIRLAHKLVPTVIGQRVELVVVDNKSDRVEAANAAAALAYENKVSAVLGSWGSPLSIVGGDIFADAKTPAVAISATNPNVTRGNDYYFRVCFLDSFQGAAAADYAVNALNVKKIAVIREISNDYAVGLARFFADHFIKLTGNQNAVVVTADFNSGGRDFAVQLGSINRFSPDAVFLAGSYTESALIIKQARAMGMAMPFIGGDSWDTEAFLETGGKAVEGAVFSTFFASDAPINKTSESFLKAFRAEYKKEPVAIAALGFDAYNVVLDAITRANSAEPRKIRDALARTQGFEGVAGPITINATRDAERPAVFKTVKGGKFVFLSTVMP